MSEILASRVCVNCDATVAGEQRFCRSCGSATQVLANSVTASVKTKNESSLALRDNTTPIAESGATVGPAMSTTPVNSPTQTVRRPRRVNKSLRLLVLTGILSVIFVAVTAGGLLTYYVVKSRRPVDVVQPTPTPVTTPEPLSNESLEQLLVEADADVKAGKLNEALEKLDRAGKLDTNNVEIYRLRAEALVAGSRYAEAIESYKQAIARNQNDVELYRRLGPAYEQLGQDDQAIETYTTALTLKTDDQSLRLQLARVLTRRGRFDEARKSYEQVLSSGDASSIATARQELVRLKEARDTGASKTARPTPTPVATATPQPVEPPPVVVETPKPEPPKPEPPKPEPPKPVISAQERIQRGLKLRESGDLSGAIREYQAALKQEPGKVDAYYLIGMAYEQAGDLNSALTAFERCTGGPYANVSKKHVEMLRKKLKK